MSAFANREASPAEPNELRVAIAGAGKMARHHALAITRVQIGARVVALAEPEPKARAGFLEACPGIATYASLEELLGSEDVDIVHVCTPPPTHEALARVALESGRHIYVEKPFAQTREAAERILALAMDKGLRVCAGHQLLFEAPVRRARELLPSLGTIHHIESYFAFRPVRRGAAGSQPLRGDLQLLDVLPHPVYSLLHFLELAVPDGDSRIVSFELGAGTLHALLRRGPLTATLVVTLEGRPVASDLNVVGTNGSLTADFVRSTVQYAIGPGASMIDKMLNPYRLARQLAVGTTRALASRMLRRQASYPGLAEIFEAFYGAIRVQAPLPVSERNIVDTVAVCQEVAERLAEARTRLSAQRLLTPPRVAITGGTGFLGAELVRTFAGQSVPVRVFARREPPYWDRVPGVDYVEADLGRGIPEAALRDVETVIHLAAETSGGFEDHRRNSVGAAELVCRSAAAAGVRRLIHVSSLAVYAASGTAVEINEDTAVESRPRERGPYVWGKVESERVLAQLANDLGMQIKIVRPGAIIDLASLDPPGRLGRRIGNLFVAVGSPSERLGVVRRSSAARALAWMALHFDASPDVINLLEPALPTKRELVDVLRRQNPGLRVVWLPNLLLRVLSQAAVLAQKIARRGREPVNLQKVFAIDRYDTAAISLLAARIGTEEGEKASASGELLRA